ncbi:hypothetical protein SY83_12105 [Paenibacillus swuensis]|uniref:ABC transporter domain-containing protein n=1 Tax=Paenibacillus swuensis TaxID=1178515 RepID=A0A172TP67_9BACL|nr:ATP-binding cassette domain-containing protein [Paenibacillus swuensis]ANE48879.1 hypothetical protein SY83_12105 [Paenibacillus swuensis]
MALRLSQVTKAFGANPVLNNITLSVREGEFIAIVGRSGCGKSTLLRLAAGLEEATSGTLTLNEKVIKGIHPETRVMFQDARLLPWRTVLDNVKIGVTGRSVAETTDRALDVLRAVGLQDKAGEWPSVLSGGQRQRVALARALAGQPKLLLLDEPLGALDALTRIEMQQLIESLWQERGFTSVLVTHDVSEAVALADRVILIEHGEVALDVQITLARPREKDSGFLHFEKQILNRVLLPEQQRETPGKVHFEI